MDVFHYRVGNGKTGLKFHDYTSGLLLLEVGLVTAQSGFWGIVGTVQVR